jgi:hypothetical protein
VRTNIPLLAKQIMQRSWLKLLFIAIVEGVMAPWVSLQAQTLSQPRTIDQAQAWDGWLNLSGPNSQETSQTSQITNVSALRDVSPQDWAYEALNSLVKRYGCIVGYPDRTFRGNRALSRWEFAAGLNTCINALERLLQENVAVLREDLDKLKRLAQNFEQELKVLGTKIDNLEARTAYVEDQTFSTTTKLNGVTVLGLVGVAAGEKNQGQTSVAKNPTLGYRNRLEFNTSFTGEDLLFTRLATGNQTGLVDETGTFQSTLSFAQPNNNEVTLEQLNYRFPATENMTLWIEGFGGGFDDFNNTMNALDGDGNFGAISRFGTRSPIYHGAGGSGIGMQSQWGDFQLSGGYLAPDASNPEQGNGLFNGAYGAIAQIGYVAPDQQNTGVMLTYRYGYNTLDTEVGSQRSNFQFFTEDQLGQAVPVSSNSYGIEFSVGLTEQFILGGWGGYTHSRPLNSLDGQLNQGSLDIWNWAITLAFPDAFQEGNLGGIVIGMQPWVASSNVVLNTANGSLSAKDRNTSLHIEAFYQYVVNNNIQITPGIVVITAPDNDDRNSPLVIGTIRTTFTF